MLKLAVGANLPRAPFPAVNRHGVPNIAPVRPGALPGSVQGAPHAGMVPTGPAAAPTGSQPAGADAHLFAGLGDTMAKGLSMPQTGRNVYASYRAGMKKALEQFSVN